MFLAPLNNFPHLLAACKGGTSGRRSIETSGYVARFLLLMLKQQLKESNKEGNVAVAATTVT